MKLHGTLLTVLALTVSSPVFACDLAHLPFGDGPEAVGATFHFEYLGGDELGQADTRANRVCDTLPPTAVMRFTFLKGKLARVAIENREGAGELLKVAEDDFGVADQRPPEGDAYHDNFKQHWAADGKPVVLYTRQPAKDHFSEYLAVTERGLEGSWADVTAKEEENAKPGGAK